MEAFDPKAPGKGPTPTPVAGRDRLVNRSGTQSCAPCAVYAPTSLEEIQVLVRTAGETRQCIRVAGSLSAHNDSAMSKDMVISLERYDAVHMIDCDKAIIMVQAGIVLRKLYEKLASFDLGLKHCGPDADVTLAGALSVGHHGEPRRFSAGAGRQLPLWCISAQGRGRLGRVGKDW